MLRAARVGVAQVKFPSDLAIGVKELVSSPFFGSPPGRTSVSEVAGANPAQSVKKMY